MDIPLEWLYTRGNYYLVEHIKEDGMNIYSKGKYSDRENFLNNYKRYLTDEQLSLIDQGSGVTIPQKDGMAFHFRHINI